MYGVKRIKVKFYECNNKSLDNKKIKYAVIIARHKNKWFFCKHKKHTTYDCLGGHREAEENLISTAERSYIKKQEQ